MLRPFFLSLAFTATCAQAEGLKIVTDIAPIGSLVSMITGEDVTILVEPGQSPHDASLKPSMANALQEADVVIWMGEAMTPGLEKPISQLASRAVVLELLELENVELLDARESVTFIEEDHEDEHGDEHEGEHEDEHEDEHDHHHDHEGDDPHAWLSVSVAQAWSAEIAKLLIATDPNGEATYLDGQGRAMFSILDASSIFNATAKEAGFGSLAREKILSGGKPVVALHDAFQYLEHEFGLNVIGAVSGIDGTTASASRLSEMTALVAEQKPACLISDASETGLASERMAATLGLKIVPLDILGTNQSPGPELYRAMIVQIAKDLAPCL